MADDAEPSLGEILSREPTGESTAPPAAQTRDESGKFSKEPANAEEKAAEPTKVEPAPEPKPEEKPAEKRGELAALIDERRRRQAAEARLKEFETKQPAKAPSVFEDEGRAISHHVDANTRTLRESLFNQSMKIARLVHQDFGTAEEAFAKASEKDEGLIQRLIASEDPGEFIHSVGTQIRELSDVGGDFGKYREKLASGFQSQITERDTKIAALTAELDQLKGTAKALDNLPTSLNRRSSGPVPKGGEGDDEALTSIVRFGTRKT